MKQETNRGFMYGCLNKVKEEVKEFIRSKIRLLNPRGYKI